MKKMLIVVGAAIGALLVYAYTQRDGDPYGIGLWFSLVSFFFLIWIWRKLF